MSDPLNNFDCDAMIKDFCSQVVDASKESYHNNLETFEHYKARKVELASASIKDYGESILNGYNLIIEKLKTMNALEDV